jgi:pimeloyl-ACP methyl ester carboxylesterase
LWGPFLVATLRTVNVSHSGPCNQFMSSAERDLRDLGYAYVAGQSGRPADLVLRQISDPTAGFVWKGQENYDALGKAVLQWVRHQLVSLCGLEECDHGAYATPGLQSGQHAASPVLLLVCGSRPGGDAGVWGRSLCINGSTEEGAMFAYISRAQALGWSVVVAAPHGDDSPHRHLRSLCSSLLEASGSKTILAVAHSYGAALTMSLLKAEPAARRLFKGVALTDGQVWLAKTGWTGGWSLFHEHVPSADDIARAADAIDSSGMPGAKMAAAKASLEESARMLAASFALSPESFVEPTEELATLVAGIACNFVASPLPLGAPVPFDEGLTHHPTWSAMAGVSAGHESHPSTTHAATENVFEFLILRSKATASSDE